MNRKSNFIIKIGLFITALYIFGLYFVATPMDSFITFITSAPLNERGDFMAGVFGPIAFMWLVIGYLVQATELSVQKDEIIEQNSILLHELEIQKRKYDPIFNIELNSERIAIIKNYSNEPLRQLLVYYVDHPNKTMQILSICNVLSGSNTLEVPIKPPLSLPIAGKSNVVLMLVYKPS